ncbi:hypothetical protein B7494_g7456 [Chlorociboria aeruginascens]|nr:hypothetical protein B7494_g7456 [Chlorociboria aeruginascens]
MDMSSYFKLDEWAAANAAYDADTPPYWHAKVVPDAFTAISGILWSVSYILMTVKAFKEKSYAMPLYCLCLNITWEAIYGFVYGPGLVNQIVFAQYMIVDVFLFYAIIKSARHQWTPLVARNLTAIIVGMCLLCTWFHLAVAATFVPRVGRQVVFWSAWPMQLGISIGSNAQLLSRGHTKGHSINIWWTRMLGTVTAGMCFYWRIYYWPERYGYAWTPYGAFLMLASHLFDFIYPFTYAYVKNYETGGAGINDELGHDNLRNRKKRS